ncbi:MAG: acyl-CoA dehydrogenase family protein [Microthrixaceae bacterium]
MSEPDAGSDVSSLRTRAVYDQAKDEWVLNGTKAWITNGGIADIHVVVATVDTEFEGPWPGKLHHPARHSRPVDGPEVQEARHPRQPHLRGRARGRAHPRIVPARWQGQARREARPGPRGAEEARRCHRASSRPWRPSRPPALPWAPRPSVSPEPPTSTRCEYAQERHAFGKPIIMNQSIAFMLADMATQIDASRLLVWRASWLSGNGDGYKVDAEGSMSKLKAGRTAVWVTERAIQILGGYGYTREYPVERMAPRREDLRHLRGHRADPAAGDLPGHLGPAHRVVGIPATAGI